MQPHAELKSVRVTADNFNRAETDKYFGDFVKRGALGKFWHFRELPSIEIDSVRPNRDTLYSHAVWDLDAGPTTITLPNASGRFMSMIVIDEVHYVPNVFYGAGDYTLNKEEVGTRYVLTSIRTLVDPNDPADVKQVNALQDSIKVSQSGGPGKLEVPNWDLASQSKVRDLQQEFVRQIHSIKQRRFDRHLLRPGIARREREQLDSDNARRGLVCHVSVIWAAPTVVRPGLDAGRYRES